MIIKIKFNYTPISLIYILLLFQMALQHSRIWIVSKIFNYYDDLLVVFFLAVLVYQLIKKQKIRQTKSILATFLVCLFIGLVSAYLSELQSLKAVVTDVWVFIRFPVIFYAIDISLYQKIDRQELCRHLQSASKVIATILFLLIIFDKFIYRIYPLGGFRYFMDSYRLMFPHPMYLCITAVVLICVLTLGIDKHKDNFIYIIFASFVALATLRTKAIMFVLVYWILLFVLYIFKLKSKLFLYLCITAGGLYAGIDQFIIYFINTGRFSARKQLLQDGVKLAKQYFPFGAGFASFGSAAASKYDSVIYTIFGYNKINNMEKYVADSFWGMIAGQYGFFGILLFVALFFILLFIVNKNDQDTISFVVLLSILAYFVVGSLSELSIFAPYAVLLTTIFSLILCCRENTSVMH